jgi:DNA-binding GntR family transcriptional regulator
MVKHEDLSNGESAKIDAASKVAKAIRSQIVAGEIRPGERLPEEKMRAELGVSRSSLREGFRLLIQERLLVHQLSRGFFVRELSKNDISDLYRVRRILECGALRQVENLTPLGLRRLNSALVSGRHASKDQDWPAVAAASIGFHQALVDLAGSTRLSVLTSQTLMEFRLSYAYMSDPFSFHEPFGARNHEIAELVRSGAIQESISALDKYLQDSEAALLRHYLEISERTKS